jgi:2-methoxy-6-polyprenyl-1,4-benzoquinol methylase
MNDLMSLGIHRLWKDHFVRSLLPPSPPSSPSPPLRILDIAGGTGDIPLRFLTHPTLISNPPQITISDINPSMLSAGRARFETSHPTLLPHLTFLEANAEHLPPSIAPSSIDIYTVAFGIRNFTDKAAALREAYRVLKPGGVFACLEFSKVTNPLLNAVYKRWSFGAIPIIGQLVAGDRDSYQYLVESIERFPDQREWQGMIEDAGFVTASQGWEDLTGGVCAIHKGVKPV